MRVNLNLIVGAVAITATAAILYMVIRQGKSIAGAAGDALNAINPANHSNIFASTADAITQAVTGDPTASLGSKIADIFDTSGAVATAPTLPANVIKLSDYFATLDQQDADMAPAPGFGSVQFVSNGGGAATGRTGMAK
jgi:hypothetical protein